MRIALNKRGEVVNLTNLNIRFIMTKAIKHLNLAKKKGKKTFVLNLLKRLTHSLNS